MLLQARFLAYNSPKTVWRPGSARTHWGSLSAAPDPLAANQGPTSKGRGRGNGIRWEGRGEEERGGEGKERDRIGGEEEGKGGKRREGRGGEGEGERSRGGRGGPP